MAREISKYDDVIDSRDVIERIAELEAEREADPAKFDASDEGAELAILKALATEGEGCADWEHGETLIRDSYFEDYAQELAEDIGAIKDNASWPYTCIDWKRAARELQQDYTSIEFDGVTYWVRS